MLASIVCENASFWALLRRVSGKYNVRVRCIKYTYTYSYVYTYILENHSGSYTLISLLTICANI